MRKNTQYRLFLLGILLLAAALRLPHLNYDLPNLYEEATPMRQAWKMWHWGNVGFDFNPHFFNYPAFYFYIQFLGQVIYYAVGWLTGRFVSPNDMRILYEQDLTELVLLARLINVVFGLAAVWAITRLGRLLCGPTTGLAAGAILAVLPLPIHASRTILVDTPLVFFVILALSAILQVQEGKDRASWIAGLCIGLAAASKYTGALLLFPLIIAHILSTRSSRSRFDFLQLPALWIGLGVSAFTFLLASPYCLLDLKAFWQDFSLERQHIAQGHFGLDPSGAIFTYLSDLWKNFGPYLLPTLLLGLGHRFANLKKDAQWIPPLAFTGLYLGTISTWSMYAIHYLLPAFPCLVVLAARGISDLHGWIHRTRPLPPWISRGAIATLLILPAGLAGLQTAWMSPTSDIRFEAQMWIQTHIPKGARIAQEFYTPDLKSETPNRATYQTIHIPIDVIQPERSAPYYDLRWFANFNYILTSQAVSKRYRADPIRFAKQIQFYQDLASRWLLVATFTDSDSEEDAIQIFRNPAEPHTDRPLSGTLFKNMEGAEIHIASNFLNGLASIFKQQGWHKMTASVYGGSSDLNPENPTPYLQLAQYFYDRKDTTRALQFYQKVILLDPVGPTPHFARGMIHFIRGQYERTASAWEKVMALSPDKPSLYSNLITLYQTMGHPDRALTVCLKVLAVDPNNRDLYFQTARYQLELGHLDQAADLLKRARRFWPEDPNFAIGLGFIYEQQNAPDLATASYQQAKGPAPIIAEILARLGTSAYQQNNPNTALRAWSAGLRADPTNLIFSVNLGSIYYQQGDLNQAATLWEQAYRFSPDNLDLIHNLLLIYRQQNNTQRATSILREALLKHPDNTTLRAALSELQDRQTTSAP